MTAGFDARIGDTLAEVVGVLRASGEVAPPAGRHGRSWRGRRPGRRGRGQHDALIYDGFVVGVGVDRLADVTRYLRAMSLRLDRRGRAPGRDDQLLATVHRRAASATTC